MGDLIKYSTVKCIGKCGSEWVKVLPSYYNRILNKFDVSTYGNLVI